MKILITGSNGLIGKEIAYQLSKNKKYDLNLLSNKRINNNLIWRIFIYPITPNLSC